MLRCDDLTFAGALQFKVPDSGSANYCNHRIHCIVLGGFTNAFVSAIIFWYYFIDVKRPDNYEYQTFTTPAL